MVEHIRTCGAVETARGGELLAAPDGGAIEVTAAPEKVPHVVETLQMDYSLKRLLMELEGQDEKARAPFDCLEEMAFPTAFAFAVAQWHRPAQPAVVADFWAWLESQVMAAIKLVPLGQTDGQRILLALGDRRRRPRQFRAGLGDLFQPA